MNWSSRQAEWSVAMAVGLMWILVGVRASSVLLLIGTGTYGAALAIFIAADARSRPETDP